MIRDKVADVLRLHWSSMYVGLPFASFGRDRKGVDCWGLLYLIYKEHFKVDVPSYVEDYLGENEKKEIARLLATETTTYPWISVIPGNEKEGDMLVFRERKDGIEAHTGMVISKGRMLHISRGRLASIESYATPSWGARFVGLYRHSELA